jgi:glyoxylase-like metal-dependent hydrolase (beta-lactamase superfamily II)
VVSLDYAPRRTGGAASQLQTPLQFPGGVGNTQKDAERFTSLYNGVVAKVFDRLPDATWVYPGHGKDTTLGAERPHLAEWRERGW